MSGYTFASLFAGIGGIDLGLERVGMRAEWQCEVDPAACAVLADRWPGVPNHGDVTAVDWHDVAPVDVIAGGFPCQDISLAGRGGGLSGKRSGLWVEMASAVRALRPRFVFVENVAALITRGLGTVLADLAEIGYDATWTCVRAADIGAPHKRNRLFIVAVNADADSGGRHGRGSWGMAPEKSEGWQRGTSRTSQITTADADDERRHGRAGNVTETRGRQESTHGSNGTTADAGSARRREVTRSAPSDESPYAGRQANANNVVVGARSGGVSTSWEQYAPAIERWERLTRLAPSPVDDRGRLAVPFVEWLMGFPDDHVRAATKRADALKALGNAVVPQCAELAWTVLAPALLDAQREVATV